MAEIKDNTCDGKCSNCGECCSDFIPVYQSDIERIKEYMKTHQVVRHKPLENETQINLQCPFRNNEEKKCDIYSIRPLICRTFMCNLKPEDALKDIDIDADRKELYLKTISGERAQPVSMTKVFYSDDFNEKVHYALLHNKEFIKGQKLTEREVNFLLKRDENEVERRDN